MALKITKADTTHYQYFKKEILDLGAGYIVSNASSIVGLFSFEISDEKAKLSFTYVYDLQAVKLAVDTFLKDYSEVNEVLYTGNQNLSKIGFRQKIYRR